jgi:hypothetical protein
MAWQAIVAMAIATPVILIPVSLVWYFNVAGALAAVKIARKQAAAKAARA